MYEYKTQEVIQQEILQNMGMEESVQEGSFYDMVTRGISYALWRFYAQMEKVIPFIFPDRTSGEPIVWAANALGLERKEGISARVALSLTGRAGTIIPAQTVFLTEDGLEFLTDHVCTIGEEESAEVQATAAQAGSKYNVDAGEICRVLTAISGLHSVANEQAAYDGVDEESYEALFDRLDSLRKSSPTSGNIAQYEQWALEVPGVGGAKCIDVWNGAGTVKVILADEKMQPVSEQVREACAAYIEDVRPAGGVVVTVESAQPMELRVSAQIQMDGTQHIEEIEARFTEVLGAYLQGIALAGGTIVYNRIAYLLLGTLGVEDFTVLTLNGGTGNIAVPEGTVPVLASVEVTA